MAELMRLGYLDKPHLSSGRVPTTLAYKKFIEQIHEDEPEIKVTLASKIKQEIFDHRFDIDDLIRHVLKIIFEETGSVGFALMGKRVYHFGLSRIPSMPEFKQVEGLCNLIFVMEDDLLLREVLSGYDENGEARVIFGEDLELEIFKRMVIVYSPIMLYESKRVFVGVIGSKRMDYNKIIPLINLIAKTVSQSIAGW
jgi:heat-inducible transcriptional repressor